MSTRCAGSRRINRRGTPKGTDAGDLVGAVGRRRISHSLYVIEQGMRSVAGSLVLLAATASALTAQPAQGSADADFFETKIRPLFVENCYACHTEARMGGLQLDSREHFLKGGKSGPIAVPGDPDASLLVKALRYNASPKMPPAGKLPADQ